MDETSIHDLGTLQINTPSLESVAEIITPHAHTRQEVITPKQGANPSPVDADSEASISPYVEAKTYFLVPCVREVIHHE